MRRDKLEFTMSRSVELGFEVIECESSSETLAWLSDSFKAAFGQGLFLIPFSVLEGQALCSYRSMTNWGGGELVSYEISTSRREGTSIGVSRGKEVKCTGRLYSVGKNKVE